MRKPLAGVLLAVALAACGGDSDNSSQNTASTQTTAATLAARLETATPTATTAATATATVAATATATPTPTVAATVAPATTAPTAPPTPTPTRAPTPAPTPPPTTAPAPPQAQTVEVKAGEWFFEPAQIAVQAGSVTFNLSNGGPDRPHTLAIRNPSGGDFVRSGQVPVGRSAAVQAELPPGTYEFYCSLPGHADRGQKGTLTVR